VRAGEADRQTPAMNQALNSTHLTFISSDLFQRRRLIATMIRHNKQTNIR
jgi:hypothetical protein